VRKGLHRCTRLARSRVVHALLAGLAFLGLTAGPAQARVAFGTGVAEVQGERVIVEVLVTVPGSTSAAPAVARALAQQDAEPVPAAGFNGLKWAQLPVRQSYNPEDAVVDARPVLLEAQRLWSTVSGSVFAMADGGLTDRCPSLTEGCAGPQYYDQQSDVGWQRLSRGTLGVTWYSPARQEADVALTTRYPWTAGCSPHATGAYDVQTVLLHELGHVAGLDHTADETAVMYGRYRGARCALAADDEAGIRALYPAAVTAAG